MDGLGVGVGIGVGVGVGVVLVQDGQGRHSLACSLWVMSTES